MGGINSVSHSTFRPIRPIPIVLFEIPSPSDPNLIFPVKKTQGQIPVPILPPLYTLTGSFSQMKRTLGAELNETRRRK